MITNEPNWAHLARPTTEQQRAAQMACEAIEAERRRLKDLGVDFEQLASQFAPLQRRAETDTGAAVMWAPDAYRSLLNGGR